MQPLVVTSISPAASVVGVEVRRAQGGQGDRTSHGPASIDSAALLVSSRVASLAVKSRVAAKERATSRPLGGGLTSLHWPRPAVTAAKCWKLLACKIASTTTTGNFSCLSHHLNVQSYYTSSPLAVTSRVLILLFRMVQLAAPATSDL